jgi:hypothetical protein
MKTQTTPWVEKTIFVSDSDKITEEDFLKFFESKKLKLGLSVTAGLIGSISNYHAITYQIEQSRFDMIGSKYINHYAIGLTAMLDLMIIIFYLMKDKKLINFSIACSILISIYTNIMIHLQTAGGSTFKKLFSSFIDPSFLISFMVSITVAIVPIYILQRCMSSLMEQLDSNNKK